MAEMVQNGCLLCIPLVAQSVEEMLSQMEQARIHGADCVELRIDHLRNFNPRVDLDTLLKARTKPAIITYRPKWEGGAYEGDEANRLDILRLAMELGADYIDVELQVASDFIKSISSKMRENSKIIVSNHNYQCTPSLEDLSLLVARIQSTGADIVKIATTATDITDVARIFRVLAYCQVPILALVMSERGLISRLLCPKFGGYLTFGSLEAGKESAPGQATLADMLNTYKIRGLGRDTKVFGLIGNPVSHSKGPTLHNRAFKEIGFDAMYVPFLVDDIKEFLKVYSSPDFAGFSVTIPYKEAALECCDEVDPIAREALSSYAVVFDAVYTPKWTRLLQDAEATGALVVSGLEMFIRQAIGQFELFTGCKDPNTFSEDYGYAAPIVINIGRHSQCPRY